MPILMIVAKLAQRLCDQWIPEQGARDDATARKIKPDCTIRSRIFGSATEFCTVI
jgi:hypothetical protein